MTTRPLLAYFLVVAFGGFLRASDEVSKPPQPSSSSINVSVLQSTSSVQYSTTPVGSPFMRHLAAEYNQDVILLNKFEKKGFGRAETITLVLIAETAQKPLKDLGNDRLKNRTPLRKMAEQAGLNYDDLYGIVYDIKKDIEAKGDNDLPPPVFEKKEPATQPVVKTKKQSEKDKEKKKEADKMETEKSETQKDVEPHEKN